MLDAMPGSAHAGQADLLGGGADAFDHGGHGGVPDGVKPAWRPASVQATTCAATAAASR